MITESHGLNLSRQTNTYKEIKRFIDIEQSRKTEQNKKRKVAPEAQFAEARGVSGP